MLGNESEPQFYEIMFQLRDYAMMGEKKLVGVGVLQIVDVVENNNNYASWLKLGKSMNIDQTGLILLKILSQRGADEIAKEFVQLKTQSRYVEPIVRR